MYIAKTEDGKLLKADNIKMENEMKFYCPGCKEKVFLKRGKVKEPHFSHYKNSDCQMFSEGETSEHLMGKKQLYQWLSQLGEDIELEAYLPQLKQRPDLLWKSKRKIAIEFQCSSLSAKKMIERTKGYQLAGYEVIWILGEHFHMHKRLTPTQRLFIHEDLNKKQKYYQLDTDKNELSILSDISSEKGSDINYSIQKIHSGEHFRVLLKSVFLKKNRFSSMNINYTKVTKLPISKEQLLSSHESLKAMAFYHTKVARQFFRILYQKQEAYQLMPIELYYTMDQEWMIQTFSFEWKYRLLQWIESFKPNRIITKKMLKNWVEKEVSHKRLIFYPLPLISPIQKLNPFIQYLQYLTYTGVLISPKKEKWTVVKKAERFLTIEQKIEKINQLSESVRENKSDTLKFPEKSNRSDQSKQSNSSTKDLQNIP